MSSRGSITEFKQNLIVEECLKANVPQIFGLHGDSNGGKSCTALILAIGLVGPDKTIGVIDGENRRSGWAADVALGLAELHYGKRPPQPLRIPLDDCHPLAVTAAIETLVERGCGAIIADCMTAAWERYLDLKEEALERMAGEDWKKREKCAMAAAAQVKPGTHGVLVRTVRSCPVHLILCFRGKKKVVMRKDENNKTVIEQDSFSTPIQETGLIFDCLVAGEVVAKDGVGGYCLWKGPARKLTHPDVARLLPGVDEQFHFRHAEALSKWCSGATTPTTAARPRTSQGSTQTELGRLKKELWSLAAPIHKCQAGDSNEILEHGRMLLNQYLIDEMIMSDAETIAELPESRLREIVAKLKARSQ